MSTDTDTEPKVVSVGRFESLEMNSSCDTLKENWKIPGTSALLSKKHCIDSLGPNADGVFEFYYDYNLYEFSEGNLSIGARDYSHSPEEAHFLGLRQPGADRLLSPADFRLPLMQAAIRYFREQGKTELTRLDPSNDLSGYSPVPTTR